jgi:hypothetical protein
MPVTLNGHSLVLDRPRRKRCDFLFLTRPYKNRPGVSYEQIFWQTQQSMRQRRPSANLATSRQSGELSIRIASDERPGVSRQAKSREVGWRSAITRSWKTVSRLP